VDHVSEASRLLQEQGHKKRDTALSTC